MRRNLPYEPFSPLRLIAPAQPSHKAGEFQQIAHAEQRPLSAHDDFGIGRYNIRPLRRNRANRPIIEFEQQPHPKAVVSLAYASQLPSAERMKRMRHAHKTCGCD